MVCLFILCRYIKHAVTMMNVGLQQNYFKVSSFIRSLKLCSIATELYHVCTERGEYRYGRKT